MSVSDGPYCHMQITNCSDSCWMHHDLSVPTNILRQHNLIHIHARELNMFDTLEKSPQPHVWRRFAKFATHREAV